MDSISQIICWTFGSLVIIFTRILIHNTSQTGKQNKVADSLSRRSYLPGEEVVLIEPEDDKSIFMAHPQEWVKATFEYNTSQPPIATINEILPVNAAKDDNASLTYHTPLVAANDDLQLTQRTSAGFGPMISGLPTEGRKARSILAQAQHFVMIDGTLFHLYYHASKICLRQIDWYDNGLYPKIIDYR